MKPLIIPCFFNTEETSQMEDLGITPGVEDLEERLVHFFQIDSLYRGYEKTKSGEKVEITCLWSCGSSYQSPLKIERILEMIQSWYEQRKT